MQALRQLMQRSDRSAEDSEVPEDLQHRLREEAKMSDEQIEFISQLAIRMTRQAEANKDSLEESENRIAMMRQQVEEQIVQWVESFESELLTAVEAEKLSEDQAWSKWDWFKDSKLEPKLDAAMKNGSLSEQQVESVWTELEQREVERREQQQ